MIEKALIDQGGAAKFGFLYEPCVEHEVEVLFGLLMPVLGEEIKRLGFSFKEYFLDEYPGTFPDCLLKTDKEDIRIELEVYSGNFLKEQDHDVKKCDLIVCWKETARIPGIKTLELSRLVQDKYPWLIKNWGKTKSGWPGPPSEKEFMELLAKNVPREDFELISDFVEGIRAEGVLIRPGEGDKQPTLNFFFENLGNVTPLTLNEKGKATIGYCTNMMNGTWRANFSDDVIEKLKNVVGEPVNESYACKPRPWHNIESSSVKELVDKLRVVVRIMLEANGT